MIRHRWLALACAIQVAIAALTREPTPLWIAIGLILGALRTRWDLDLPERVRKPGW